jgi:Kef-type K+ transport system membrane component KefB/nucleotide-binding universal stress UspA family protein
MNGVDRFLGGGHDLVLLLIVQVTLILALSRLIGLLFQRMNQPQVVGEMLAGIMLGPSLFGWLAPHAWAAVFPSSSIEYLNVLSQVGIIFFLFLVGLELDPKLIRNRGHAAVIISQVSIIAPFLLGALLTIILYHKLFQNLQHATAKSVVLFMGASLSVTAFPVLARILTERNLHRTKVGAVTITAAAMNDLTAWCMLALVIGIARATGISAGLYTAGWATLYVLTMFFAVRPFLRRLQQVHERQQRLSQTMVGAIIVMVLISSYITEIIGIHALFGAFLLGAIMPKGNAFVRTLTEKLEDFTVVFLLPVFFAYTGLKTRIGVLNTGELWFYCVLFILIACIGKFGGSAIAARACGMPWREAGAIGILMNTRGLMELVILNVGRELGVITEAVFAMMVIMALTTTALTTPILHWVYPRKLMEQEQITVISTGYKVLIPVSLPSSGASLLRVASALTGDDEDRQIIALALNRPVDRDAHRLGVDFNEPPERAYSLQPLLSEAARTKIPVTAVSYISRDVPSDISRTARLRNVDLILMGFHNPVYTSSILGGTVHRVLTGSDSDVAIFVERGDSLPRNILVPYMGSKHDRLAMQMAGRIARNTNVPVTVLHVTAPNRGDHESQKLNAQAATDRAFNDPSHPLPVTMRTIESDSPVNVVIEQAKEFELVIIGVAEEWGLESQLLGFRAERVAREVACSLLIVRKHGAFAAARGIEVPKEESTVAAPVDAA